MKVVVEIDTNLRNEVIIWGLRHGVDVGRRGGFRTSDAIRRILVAFLSERKGSE